MSPSLSKSPGKLEGQKREHKIQIGLPLFTIQKAPLNYSKATTSFVTINPKYLSYPLVISDAIRNTTYFFNKDLSVADSFTTSGPTVGIEFNLNGFLTCNIGVLNPNNGKFGSGQFIKKEGGDYRDNSKIITKQSINNYFSKIKGFIFIRERVIYYVN